MSVSWVTPWLRNVPSLPLIPDCLLTEPPEGETGGQNAQQLVLELDVFLQMMWWVVSPWNVYTANPDGPTAIASWASTAFTCNDDVAAFVTYTLFLPEGVQISPIAR